MDCPHCTEGKVFAFVNRGPDISRHTQELLTCRTCGGSGHIDEASAARIVAGKRMRDERVARQKTLREAAADAGISPSSLSAIEQGRGPAEAYNR